jgi:hypothetical protein
LIAASNGASERRPPHHRNPEKTRDGMPAAGLGAISLASTSVVKAKSAITIEIVKFGNG